jgi:hypothetical protein
MSTQKDNVDVFKCLYNSLTGYQKSLHIASGPTGDPNHYDNQIPTPFVTQFRKGVWYLLFDEKLLPTLVSDNTYSFSTNMKPHGLLRTDISFQLPHIVFKDGHVGRWTHNVGSNAVASVVCEYNSSAIQKLTHIYFDFHTQTFTSSDQHDSYQTDLGNLPTLTHFQKVLPRHNTSYTIPWFFSKDDSTFFRLCYCSFMDRLNFIVIYRETLSKLLQIKQLTDDDKDNTDFEAAKGTLIPHDNFTSDLYRIEGRVPKEADPPMPKPSMYGKYLYLSDVECQYNICPPIDEGPRNIFDIDEVIVFESDEKINLDYKKLEKVLIKKENISSKHPAYIVYAGARNETAYSQNYYSNYSTNSHNHLLGYSPIEDVSISPQSEMNVVKDIPGWRMERSNARNQFVRAPFEAGYIGWSGGVKAKNNFIIPGNVWEKGSVKLNLKDTNPYHIKDNLAEHEPDTKYQLVVVLVCNRRLIFTKHPTTDAERGRPDTAAIILSEQ